MNWCIGAIIQIKDMILNEKEFVLWPDFHYTTRGWKYWIHKHSPYAHMIMYPPTNLLGHVLRTVFPSQFKFRWRFCFTPWIPDDENRYTRLLFTSEDKLCANLRVQEQSQIWHDTSTWPPRDVTCQRQWRHNTKKKAVLRDNGEMSDCFSMSRT